MQHKIYLLNSVAFEDLYSTHFPNGFEAIIKFNIILTEVIKYIGGWGWDVCAHAHPCRCVLSTEVDIEMYHSITSLFLK